jgi:endoglucanase
MSTNRRRIITFVSSCVACLAVAPQAFAAGRAAHDGATSSKSGTVAFSSAVYQATEKVGRFAVTLQRTDTSGQETVYYGVTNKGAEAGNPFDKVPNSSVTFAPGQSTATFYLTINDQGINGPMRFARAYLYGAHPQHLGTPTQATIELLQNDPLGVKNPQNPLGYTQTPTNGDPLQYVHWYVFGSQAAPGKYAHLYQGSQPAWAQALDRLAESPGSWSYRFWMWNQPAATLATTVEKYLADAEVAQPNTTVALSTYSLVHGACESPSAIEKRYQDWITQLAHGIGNFRVVLYLEEDSLMETHCLTHAQLQVRLKDELAYAVNVLSQDPHVLIYMDAGAPDGWLTPQETARDLRKADIAQAAGFFVNATHYDWLTTDIHYGQEIAHLTGGKHFIVQSDDSGRGPLVPSDRKDNGNESLCNPAGRGAGPLSWNTGYEYLDGMLWFNDPGNSDGPCGAGDPGIGVFWPAYAVGLIQHGTRSLLGPHAGLAKSRTNM